MTNNILGDNRIETTVTAEKTSFKKNTSGRNSVTLNNSLVTMGYIRKAYQKIVQYILTTAINLIRTTKRYIMEIIFCLNK